MIAAASLLASATIGGCIVIEPPTSAVHDTPATDETSDDTTARTGSLRIQLEGTDEALVHAADHCRLRLEGPEVVEFDFWDLLDHSDVQLPDGHYVGIVEGCPDLFDVAHFEFLVDSESGDGHAGELRIELRFADDGAMAVDARHIVPGDEDVQQCAEGDVEFAECPDGIMVPQWVCEDGRFWEVDVVCEGDVTVSPDVERSHEGFGDGCEINEHLGPFLGVSDMCIGAADVCAAMPGSPVGVCSTTGCGADPLVCPEAWGCLNVFMPDGICVPPDVVDQLGLDPIHHDDDHEVRDHEERDQHSPDVPTQTDEDPENQDDHGEDDHGEEEAPEEPGAGYPDPDKFPSCG